ncbi:DUF2867 domain-containing protein [Aminobacter anthyllidis]|uniref:DUF2867 domain-containing protein n=1 Tax=Aminobacter anthyllidis TaxID=1035067 RepID=A0A9X1AFS0_9HYPH|nr:DUF2867 domain-containing protein [Aminobacter anthyllidis]MBT1158918.1 DUF2867 domain-containing protein [Aminobacter anthyllidis]
MPVVPVVSNAEQILPGASFTDRFAVVVSGERLDVGTAAERVFRHRPSWIGALMALRNLLVRPFGLKTRDEDLAPELERKGMFPVLSQSERQMVLGLDDRHLDFRLLVELKELGGGRQEVSATTLVRPHNMLGRAYLCAVMPFHKIIVPAMLARAAKP